MATLVRQRILFLPAQLLVTKRGTSAITRYHGTLEPLARVSERALLICDRITFVAPTPDLAGPDKTQDTASLIRCQQGAAIVIYGFTPEDGRFSQVRGTQKSRRLLVQQ